MQLSDVDLVGDNFLRAIPGFNILFFGNSLYTYVLTAISFVVIWFLLAMTRTLTVRKLTQFSERSSFELMNFSRDLLKSIHPVVLPLLALYVATRRLEMSDIAEKIMTGIILVILTVQVIVLLGELITFLVSRSRVIRRNPNDQAANNTSKNIIVLLKFVLWAAGVLFVLGNFGINVSTFVAGLGIGGVAIALAAQAILGDAFSSFAIALDKPFEVGDFIIIDDLAGTVEFVGLKTTRLRSLGGELLILSNSDMTRSRIKNYKKMYERRINFKLGVTYDTPYERLVEIPRLIKDAIETTGSTRFDRAHFFSYGEFALTYDIVYFMTLPDYNLYMDAQQTINLKLHKAFEARGIAFALPAQTIYLAKSERGGSPINFPKEEHR